MAEYTQLEYIESTGTQYIDTSVGFNYEITMDIQFINNNSNEQLMGHSAAGGSYFGINKDGYYENGRSPEFSYLGTDRRTIKLIGTSKTQTLIVEGETSTISRSSSTVYSFKLLGGLRNYPCSAKLYSCQFYVDGTLVRDYVPCETSEGEIGLWDNVEGKFYGNNGEGKFIAGPEVIVNYLYNGIEKPPLPDDWDREKLPFVVILKGSWHYPLVAFPDDVHFKFGPTNVYLVVASYDEFWTSTGGRWLKYTPFGGKVPIDLIAWANFDIYNGDGSLYLPASYPINAETGEEITDYGLYHFPINPPNPTAMLMGYMVGQAI